MKIWVKRISIVLVVLAALTFPLFPREAQPCCLCDSFRYHAPCLIDLETGELLELDLYFPSSTKVAELADPQPEMGTFSFVRIGNVSGTKLTDSKTIDIHIPNEKTFSPALCSDCRNLLPFGYTKRYILADLYGKEEKKLIPIKANSAFSLRCYDIAMEKDAKSGISIAIQGTLE